METKYKWALVDTFLFFAILQQKTCTDNKKRKRERNESFYLKLGEDFVKLENSLIS
jgi:hypothetical protein